MIGQVFEDNYERFKRYLKGRFFSLNDFDVEDIVQDAAMKLLYRAENLGGIKDLTSYVYTTLQNGAKDHFKKRKKETLTPEDTPRTSDGSDVHILVKELKQTLLAAIDGLEEKQRYVYVETEINGRSYDELVRETGDKLGTLLSRKNRAVKKLKNAFRDYIDKEEPHEK